MKNELRIAVSYEEYTNMPGLQYEVYRTDR